MRIFVDYYERKENPHKAGTAAHFCKALDIAMNGKYRVTRYPQSTGDLNKSNILEDSTIDFSIFSLKRKGQNLSYEKLWQIWIREND